MSVVVGVSLGIGLAAACGFRVFLPCLVISAAAKAELLTLSEGFTWMGGWPALCCFAVATVVEIGAYYVPWLDNLLDSIATPAAGIAGIVVAASCITDLDPMLKWTLVVIAGGGTAGVIKFGMAKARIVSTLTTGGLANPVVATAESGTSLVLCGLAVFVPIVAGGLVLVVMGFVIWRIVRYLKQGPASGDK